MRLQARFGLLGLMSAVLLLSLPAGSQGMLQNPDPDARDTDEDGVALPEDASFIGFQTNLRLELHAQPNVDPHIFPDATLVGTTIRIDETRCVFHRPGRLAEETLTLLREPTTIRLHEAGGAADRLTIREILPDADITEIELVLSRPLATLQIRGDTRELPIRLQGGVEAGLRIRPVQPIQIRVAQPTHLRLAFDLAASLQLDPDGALSMLPVISLIGRAHTLVRGLLPSILPPTVFPDAVHANTPTNVVVSVQPRSADVDPTSLQLVRVLTGGGTTSLGALNDAGTSGDAVAGDGYYSAQTTINEAVGEVTVRIDGMTPASQPVSSLALPIYVLPSTAPLGPNAYNDIDNGVLDNISGFNLLPGRLLVSVRPGTSFSELVSIASLVGGSVAGRIPGTGFWQFSIPGDGTGAGVWNAAFLVADEAAVEAVTPEPTAGPHGVTPNDPTMPAQTILNDLSIRAGWMFQLGSGLLNLGVVDTGVITGHPDLSRVRQGRDWTLAGLSPATDNSDHGTDVAGILGADTHNGIDMSGVVWAGTVFVEKSIGGIGGIASFGSESLGIVETVRHGSHVINMSFGTPKIGQPSGAHSWASRAWRQFLHARKRARKAAWRAIVNAVVRVLALPLRGAMDYAHVRNRLTVASAGNENRNGPNYPAEWADLAVAATDPTFISLGQSSPVTANLAIFIRGASNFQPAVDVAATGGNLIATSAGPHSFTAISRDGNFPAVTVTARNLTDTFGGTSGAAPITSGVAALYFSAQGLGGSRLSVRNAVIDGATDGGADVLRTQTGVTMAFRQIDAAETFNPLWNQSGLWRNQKNIARMTVHPAAQLASRPWFGGATPTFLNPATAVPASAGTSAWWFGSPVHGTYLGVGFPPGGGRNSAAPVQGVLTTPCMTSVNSTTPILQFKTWFEIEAMDPHVRDIMEVRAADCVTGQVFVLATLNPASPPPVALRTPTTSWVSTAVAGGGTIGTATQGPSWQFWRIDLSQLAFHTAGHPFLIEFDFDSRDVGCNDHMGWVIDEVRVLDAGNPANLVPATPTPLMPTLTPSPIGPRTSPGGC